MNSSNSRQTVKIEEKLAFDGIKLNSPLGKRHFIEAERRGRRSGVPYRALGKVRGSQNQLGIGRSADNDLRQRR